MLLRAAPALALVWLLVAACDGDIGTGGGNPGSSAASVRPAPSGPAQTPCDAIAECMGDTKNASSGCRECAILGNDTLASNGGTCLDEYIGCFGYMGSCDDGGHPDCCAFYECLIGCPEDNPDTTNNEFLDCACTNDGADCTEKQEQGTCLGENRTGGQRYVAWANCLYVDACPTSCAE